MVKHFGFQGGDRFCGGSVVARGERTFGEFERGEVDGIERLFAEDRPACLVREVIGDVGAGDLFEIDAFVALLVAAPDVERDDDE